MKEVNRKPSWLKPINKDDKHEVVQGKDRPWDMDPKGYFLLKPNYEDKTLHAGHCDVNNKLTLEIVDTRAQAVYGKIVELGLVSKFEHAAYLGKELKKMELAVRYGLEYVQDEDLDFEKKKKD